MGRTLSRREVTRAVPLLLFGSAALGLSRLLTACASPAGRSLLLSTSPREGGTPAPPTDDDELVVSEPKPVDTGEQPPHVPNPVWEARARQLEDDQSRLYGAVFSNDPDQNGVMRGKERSHVPQLALAMEGALKRVTVTVQHVMGTSGLDAGMDAAADAPGDAASEAAAEAGDGDGGSVDASPVDAAKPPEHYITTIYLRADVAGGNVVVGLWEFSPTDPAPPSAKFTLPEGAANVVAFEWCTLHGLWRSDLLPV